MAKVTLQAVRGQHGDDSPAALVAFHSAVAAHNAYIQVRAVWTVRVILKLECSKAGASEDAMHVQW